MDAMRTDDYILCCANCGEEDKANLEVVREHCSEEYRGEVFTAEKAFLRCSSCGYEDSNPKDAFEFGRYIINQYLSKHGLLLGNEIKDYKDKLGLNYDQIAGAIGVSTVTIKRWAKGFPPETISHGHKLRNYFEKLAKRQMAESTNELMKKKIKIHYTHPEPLTGETDNNDSWMSWEQKVSSISYGSHAEQSLQKNIDCDVELQAA